MKNEPEHQRRQFQRHIMTTGIYEDTTNESIHDALLVVIPLILNMTKSSNGELNMFKSGS